MTRTQTKLVSAAVKAARAEPWWDRCDWCGWTIAQDGHGCSALDCSMRPRPPETTETRARQLVRRLVEAAERQP